MNYLVLHRQSNLIDSIISASNTLTDSETYRFIPVSDATMDKYYRLVARLPHPVPVGDLAAVSPAVLEALGGNAEAPPRVSTRPKPRKRSPFKRGNAACSPSKPALEATA